MNKYWYRGISLLLLLIFLFCGCTAKQPSDTRPTSGQDTVTVSAVGDISLTEDMLSAAKQPNGSYDFTEQFAGCFAATSQADLTIGNLEGNFTASEHGNNNYPDAFAATLAMAGFDILQTANSYSIQNGLSGLSRTKSVIENAGMRALGTYSNEADREENLVLFYEINNIRIAIVAFTKGMGGLALPENTGSSVNLLYSDYTTNYEKVDTAAIVSVLEDAKALAPDVTIAALHWGSENISTISKTQEEIADLMFENGVDVILGSHSHLIGSVERRHIKLEDESRNDVLLAYSLGDFCAVEAGDGCNMSLVLNLEFTREHASGNTKISSVSYTPIAALDQGKGVPDRYQIMDADNVISLYENNYYNRITASLYEALVEDKESLAEKLGLN